MTDRSSLSPIVLEATWLNRFADIHCLGNVLWMLILQKAIVSASRKGSEWTDIACSIAGVVFLGTPHRGCAAASWGNLIATLGQWGIGSQPSILRTLEAHSDALTDLLRDFSRWIWDENVPVVCCFENLPTNYGARIASPVPITSLVSTAPVSPISSDIF